MSSLQMFTSMLHQTSMGQAASLRSILASDVYLNLINICSINTDFINSKQQQM